MTRQHQHHRYHHDDYAKKEEEVEEKKAFEVDICATCIADKPPKLPLREELRSLGFEIIYKAAGVGKKAMRHEAHRAVHAFRQQQQVRDLTKRRFFPKSSRHIQAKLAERKRIEHELRLPRAVSYESYQEELKGDGVAGEVGCSFTTSSASTSHSPESTDGSWEYRQKVQVRKGPMVHDPSVGRARRRWGFLQGRRRKMSLKSQSADELHSPPSIVTITKSNSNNRFSSSMEDVLKAASFPDYLAPFDEDPPLVEEPDDYGRDEDEPDSSYSMSSLEPSSASQGRERLCTEEDDIDEFAVSKVLLYQQSHEDEDAADEIKASSASSIEQPSLVVPPGLGHSAANQPPQVKVVEGRIHVQQKQASSPQLLRASEAFIQPVGVTISGYQSPTSFPDLLAPYDEQQHVKPSPSGGGKDAVVSLPPQSVATSSSSSAPSSLSTHSSFFSPLQIELEHSIVFSSATQSTDQSSLSTPTDFSSSGPDVKIVKSAAADKYLPGLQTVDESAEYYDNDQDAETSGIHDDDDGDDDRNVNCFSGTAGSATEGGDHKGTVGCDVQEAFSNFDAGHKVYRLTGESSDVNVNDHEGLALVPVSKTGVPYSAQVDAACEANSLTLVESPKMHNVAEAWLLSAKFAFDHLAAGVYKAAGMEMEANNSVVRHIETSKSTDSLSALFAVLARVDTQENEVKELLESSPELVQVRQQDDGRLPIHILCGRGMPDRSSVPADSLTDYLLKDIRRFNKLMTIVLSAHTDACSIADKKGDLPCHLVARSFMEWEARWYESVYQQAAQERDPNGKTAIAITQLYQAMSETVESLLRPIAMKSDLCSLAGSVGCILPIHIACTFTSSVNTIRLILEANPETAATRCSLDKIQSFVPDGTLPLELHDTLSTDFPKWEVESTPGADPEIKWSQARGTKQDIDDCIRRSDLLFAYYPFEPFMSDKARIRRLESRVQFEAKQVVEHDAKQGSRAVERLWVWFCTWTDQTSGRAAFESTVKRILETLPLRSVRYLASVVAPDGRLTVDAAATENRTHIMRRLELLTESIVPIDSSRTSVSSISKSTNESILKSWQETQDLRLSTKGQGFVGYLCRVVFDIHEALVPTSFVVLPYKLCVSAEGKLGMESSQSASTAVKFAEYLLQLTDPRSILYFLESKIFKVHGQSIYSSSADTTRRAQVFEKVKKYEDALIALYEPGLAYLYLVDEATGMPVVLKGSAIYPLVLSDPTNLVRKLLPLMIVGMILMRGEKALSVLISTLLDETVTKVPANWVDAAKALAAYLYTQEAKEHGRSNSMLSTRDKLVDFVTQSPSRLLGSPQFDSRSQWSVELSILKVLLELNDPERGFAGLESALDDTQCLMWTLKEKEIRDEAIKMDDSSQESKLDPIIEASVDTEASSKGKEPEVSELSRKHDVLSQLYADMKLTTSGGSKGRIDNEKIRLSASFASKLANVRNPSMPSPPVTPTNKQGAMNGKGFQPNEKLEEESFSDRNSLIETAQEETSTFRPTEAHQENTKHLDGSLTPPLDFPQPHYDDDENYAEMILHGRSPTCRSPRSAFVDKDVLQAGLSPSSAKFDVLKDHHAELILNPTLPESLSPSSEECESLRTDPIESYKLFKPVEIMTDWRLQDRSTFPIEEDRSYGHGGLEVAANKNDDDDEMDEEVTCFSRTAPTAGAFTRLVVSRSSTSSSSQSRRTQLISKYSLLFHDLALDSPEEVVVRERAPSRLGPWNESDRVWTEVSLQLHRRDAFLEDARLVQMKVLLAEEAKRLALLNRCISQVREEAIRLHSKHERWRGLHLGEEVTVLVDDQASVGTATCSGLTLPIRYHGLSSTRRLLIRLCELEERMLCDEIAAQHLSLESYSLSQEIQEWQEGQERRWVPLASADDRTTLTTAGRSLYSGVGSLGVDSTDSGRLVPMGALNDDGDRPPPTEMVEFVMRSPRPEPSSSTMVVVPSVDLDTLDCFKCAEWVKLDESTGRIEC